MCAVKPCHLVPKYLFRKGDLLNRKKPESYCLPTTCGTSHEGNYCKIIRRLYKTLCCGLGEILSYFNRYHIFQGTQCILIPAKKTENGCMNVSKYNTRPNILFFVPMQGTFYCQQVKNKKGVSYN